jgi:imidazole glycerol phosphate synthase glutamine amidotransferase subunit
MKVTLIDYGACNVSSVERALQRLGAQYCTTSTSECIAKAEALILPGVGHYATLMHALDERNLRAPLLAAIAQGVPFLGICLGLQALYERSEEAPDLKGLGLFSGSVRGLPAQVKLPHMGWNQLRVKRDSRLLQRIDSRAYFYFAHSYAAADDSASTHGVATCTHGQEFLAVLEKKNIFAVQFHPEKSGAAGAQLLRNFLEFTA